MFSTQNDTQLGHIWNPLRFYNETQEIDLTDECKENIRQDKIRKERSKGLLTFLLLGLFQ